MQYGKNILISSQNVKELINQCFDEHLNEFHKNLDNYNVFAPDHFVKWNVPPKTWANGILLMLDRRIGFTELEDEKKYFLMNIDLRGNGRGKRIKIKPVENVEEAFSKYNSVYKAEIWEHEESVNKGTRWGCQLSFDLSLWTTHFDQAAQIWRKLVVGFTMCKKNPNYIGRNVPIDNAPTAHAETMELETAE